MSLPRLLVIICSTRPGRVGKPVADWFVERVHEDGRFDVEVADLAELNLPFMDEPNHPMKHEYTKDHTKAWSAKVTKADAVVFVMPEYNHAMNAPMKNAIDFLYHEWKKLAASFVSYGGVSGGLRAVVHAQTPLIQLGAVLAISRVTIPFVGPKVVDGAFAPTPEVSQSVAPLLEELAELVELLAPARAKAREKLAE